MSAPDRYEITIRGRLSDTLLAAFDGLTAKVSAAETVLRGEIVDQAALYGVLERIESLGLELLDVHRTPSAARGGLSPAKSIPSEVPPCHPC
jgi:hypothetical protein